MKHLIIFIALLLAGNSLLAQNTHFTFNGTVEYEKSINMFAYLKKMIEKRSDNYLQNYYETYRRNNPQFKKLKSVLTFSKDKTLFKPLPDESVNNNGFFGGDPTMEQNNTIFNDLLTNTSITQKKVFEELFLLKDSTRKINWKITDETKDIAGYTCRRANALVLDSVYVVAFYSDEIPVSSGPESFSGLPGMILGVALPHENLTWFATKVTDVPVDPKNLAAPVKGKSVNLKELKDILHKAMADRGDYATIIYKAFLL